MPAAHHLENPDENEKEALDLPCLAPLAGIRSRSRTRASLHRRRPSRLRVLLGKAVPRARVALRRSRRMGHGCCPPICRIWRAAPHLSIRRAAGRGRPVGPQHGRCLPRRVPPAHLRRRGRISCSCRTLGCSQRRDSGRRMPSSRSRRSEGSRLPCPRYRRPALRGRLRAGPRQLRRRQRPSPWLQQPSPRHPGPLRLRARRLQGVTARADRAQATLAVLAPRCPPPPPMPPTPPVL